MFEIMEEFKHNTSTQALRITKEMLLEIGGWRAMHEGKALYEGGKVLSCNYTPPMLVGVVHAGSSTVNARLKIGHRLADVENLCSCRQAREYGTVCPHVIALGLSAMNQQHHSNHADSQANPNNGKETHSSKDKVEEGLTFKRYSIPDAPAGTKVGELFILLPTDFKGAWANDSFRVILEVAVDGQASVPLSVALESAQHQLAFYEVDLKILQFIEKLCQQKIFSMWMLPKEHRTDFFEALLLHPRVMLGKKTHVSVQPSSHPSELNLDVRPNGDLVLHLSEAGANGYLYAPGSLWHLHGDKLELQTKLPKAYQLLRQQDVLLPRNAVGHFLQHELPLLEKNVQVKMSDACRGLKFHKTKPKIKVSLDGFLAGLNAKFEIYYGNTGYVLGGYPTKNARSQHDWIPDPDDLHLYHSRDWELEQALRREVMACGFLPGQKNADVYTLASETKVSAFLANVFPTWKSKWKVTLSERMQNFHDKCEWIQPEIQIQAQGENWLDLSVTFNSNSTKSGLNHAEVQRLLQTGASYHRMDNGKIALLPTQAVKQFQEVLFDCHVEGRGDGTWKLEKHYASYLHGVLSSENWQISSQSNWQPPTELQQYAEIEIDPSLSDILRSYQKRGVYWLNYLYANKLGGILADEMGLGKTVQTLTYFLFRKKANQCHKPFLIIGPTSLVKNWQAEAQKFTPSLTTLILHGPQRKLLFKEITSHDIVITSYSLLRRDIEELQSYEFDTVVLDEAQNIKNRASQNAQSAKALKATHRLVLTGTPIENSLLDLWSIFDFLMPGYLGPAKEFKERYEIPIAKNGETAPLNRLVSRIRPFVLRRTKAEVAKDLPAKIEHTSFCELTEEQRGVYQSILEQSRKEVFGSMEQKSAGRQRIAVLTALTRLRQACCHLDLLPKVSDKTWTEPSGKMNYFMELLDEAVQGGHRILVFSQFVQLLKLIETAIKAREVKYCYLDGSTVERLAVVDRFQSEADIPVFLISLKAGGAGLNITGADTVIHFDPWWNPAVEDQATARAHRMGQSKIVSSYKLIARGTVEEKIVQLQQRKKDLIANTMVSEESLIHSLSWEELQSLLE